MEAVILTEREWDSIFEDSDREAARQRLRDHEWPPVLAMTRWEDTPPGLSGTVADAPSAPQAAAQSRRRTSTPARCRRPRVRTPDRHRVRSLVVALRRHGRWEGFLSFDRYA